jgi:hypothetical protein
MAVPTPRTWSAGETVTAALLNTELRDALLWLLTPPYLHVYQTAVQIIATSTVTALTFPGELVDTISGHSTSVNTSRYTPNVAGKYLCLGHAAYDASTGERYAQFRKNGTAVTGSGYAGYDAFASGFAHNSALAIATIDVNGSTDYIELWTAQNSGASVGTDSGAPSFMICQRVSS